MKDSITPQGDALDFLDGISELVNRAHSKASTIRMVSGDRDTDDKQKIELSRSALGMIKTWLHNVRAKFPKLRKSITSLQVLAELVPELVKALEVAVTTEWDEGNNITDAIKLITEARKVM